MWFLGEGAMQRIFFLKKEGTALWTFQHGGIVIKIISEY